MIYDSEPVGFDVKHLLIALAIVFFTTLIVGIKIFLSNQIYITSRNINKLELEHSLLTSENRELSRKLEVIKYRYLSGNVAPLPIKEENDATIKDVTQNTKKESETKMSQTTDE